MKGYALTFLKGRCHSIWVRGKQAVQGEHRPSSRITCRVSMPDSPHNGYQCLAKRTAAGPLHKQLEIAVLLESRNRIIKWYLLNWTITV